MARGGVYRGSLPPRSLSPAAAEATIPEAASPSGTARPPSSTRPSGTAYRAVLLAISYAGPRWDDHGLGRARQAATVDAPDRRRPAGQGRGRHGRRERRLAHADHRGRPDRPEPGRPAARPGGEHRRRCRHCSRTSSARWAWLPVAGTDAADWYGAVAAYGANDTATAATFAEDVYRILAKGAARTTNAGQRLVPAATVAPDRGQLARTGLKTAAAGERSTVRSSWPANGCRRRTSGTASRIPVPTATAAWRTGRTT